MKSEEGSKAWTRRKDKETLRGRQDHYTTLPLILLSPLPLSPPPCPLCRPLAIHLHPFPFPSSPSPYIYALPNCFPFFPFPSFPLHHKIISLLAFYIPPSSSYSSSSSSLSSSPSLPPPPPANLLPPFSCLHLLLPKCLLLFPIRLFPLILFPLSLRHSYPFPFFLPLSAVTPPPPPPSVTLPVCLFIPPVPICFPSFFNMVLFLSLTCSQSPFPLPQSPQWLFHTSATSPPHYLGLYSFPSHSPPSTARA